jgi:hypothetical protein
LRSSYRVIRAAGATTPLEKDTMAYFERTHRAGVGRGTVTSPESVKLACTFRKSQFAAVRRIAEGKGETAASAIRRLVDEALRARAARERGTRRQVI